MLFLTLCRQLAENIHSHRSLICFIILVSANATKSCPLTKDPPGVLRGFYVLLACPEQICQQLTFTMHSTWSNTPHCWMQCTDENALETSWLSCADFARLFFPLLDLFQFIKHIYFVVKMDLSVELPRLRSADPQGGSI